METKTGKKKFRMPNTYVIIFLALVLVAILTWIIPGGAYETDAAGNAIAGTYKSIDANPQGLWNIIMAPIVGMVGNESISGAIAISLNVMIFGSFLEMMNQTGVINIALSGVAKKYQHNMSLLITVLVFIMGVFGTVQGAYEEGFVYLLMFIPIVLDLGLDTIVALMIVIFGTQGGCIASIVNPFSTGIASGIAGISPGEGIIQRTIIFIIIMSLISFIIIQYAKSIKANPQKSTQYYRLEKDKEQFLGTEDHQADKTLSTGQQKVLICFILTFVLMILSLIPWTSLNSNWTFFNEFALWLENIPFLGTVLGTGIVPFGDWYFNEINGLLIIMTFLSGYFMGYDTDKNINIFIKGASDLVSTAFIIPLARGIQVVMTDGNITSTVLNFSENTLGSLSPIAFVLVALIFYLILASLIPSSTGLAAATMSIMAPLATFAGVSEALMIVIYNMALGLVKMIMPTSIIVMTCASAANVNYGEWVKSTWKYVVIFTIVCALILIAGVYVL
uniref:YfcC family protein n=1 Tax=Globicatella sulfidifaciens TaxID=136093 RepID=UPI0023F0C3F6|nr:YfcC family protein [Globicatella sulfidifaciens]